MRNRIRYTGIMLSLVLLLSVFVMGGLAQDTTDSRVLVTGFSIESELTAEQLAQIFTYEGQAGEVVKLTVSSEDGLALGAVITDAAGNAIAQAKDERANGFLVVDDVALAESGTYYVVIFPLALADVPTEGSFSISLALSNVVTQAQDDEATPATPEQPEPTATQVVQQSQPTQASVVTEFVEPSQVLTTAGLQVRLQWNATADFNLEVRDPLGGSVFWENTVTDSGGLFSGVNVNGSCETFTANAPTETVQWSPGAVPTGSYEILVFYVQDCETNGAVPFTVELLFDGSVVNTLSGTMLPNQVWMGSFSVDTAGNVSVGESGVNQDLLPATVDEIQANSVPITLGAPTQGSIINQRPYAAYTLDASAGDIVTVSMDAVSGSLDTYLFVIDDAGNILTSNDDATAETRNSAINSLLFDTDGTYTIVATRYGQRVGGTEGNFTLTANSASVTAGLSQTLVGADVPEGIIEVLLIWETNADLQLLVRDPVGDAVFDDVPVISSGGLLGANGNVGCLPAEGTPYSYVYWPAGQRIRPGTYEIDIWFQSTCDDFTPVNASLIVTIGGEVIVSDTFTPLLNDHYITTFSVGVDGSLTRGPGGIAGGSETVDYLAELTEAPQLTSNVPVVGNIADDNRFDVYTFEGNANETISLRMDATAGTLDTLVFIIGPTGVELASNDDAIPNETTNSAILDFVLPQTGQYVVIATHYGTVYGGTNGSYTLVFSRLN